VTRLKIALDARRAVRHMTGIGHYILELAKRMPALAPELEFQLLVDRPLPDGVLPEGCTQVVLGRFVGHSASIARFYSPIWLNTSVPQHVAHDRVALFHGTNSVIPLRLRCRTVCTIHDVSFMRVPHAYGRMYRRYMQAQARVALGRADAIVSVSYSSRKDMSELLGMAGDDVIVIHNGVDDEFRNSHSADYLCRVRSELELPSRYILHVGIVETKKDIETLLVASADLISARLVDSVVVAGRDGFGAREIRSRASALGLDGKARFIGFVPQGLLPGLYALATAVVFPSQYEGFGLPVLEGMASGIPVIAAESSSIPEVAGDAAVLFPPGDAVRLTAALRTVLSDAEFRADLTCRGLSRARQFTWAESAARHVAVYRQVLEGVDERSAHSEAGADKG
jgi:glycosyltransferase involved in cell wall biosynthesis